MSRTIWTTVATMLLIVAPSVSFASIFVPAGLGPGDTYHLAFLTQGTTTAISNDILTYNTFVTEEAERDGAFTKGYGIDWKAIASTAAASSFSNAIVSADVYRLDGVLIEISSLFYVAGGWSLGSTLHIDQFLSTDYDHFVWTGSDFGPFPLFPLGGFFSSSYGLSISTSQWLFFSTEVPDFLFPLYALSPLLVVPASAAVVPEPSSILVWGGLGVLCLVGRRYRSKRSN